MAGTLNVTTISGASTITGVSTLNADSGVLATQNGMTGIAKAWVNFAGASGTRNGSFNVSSVTRTATGTYTVTFTTAMVDANYSIICGTSAANGSNDGGYMGVQNGTTPTTTSFGLVTDGRTTGEYDPTYGYVAVFGT
jgi:hypothetical protein